MLTVVTTVRCDISNVELPCGSLVALTVDVVMRVVVDCEHARSASVREKPVLAVGRSGNRSNRTTGKRVCTGTMGARLAG